VLLAVISCVDSAPDKPIGGRMEYSENISAVFSRISVVFHGWELCMIEVSDGESVWKKSRFWAWFMAIKKGFLLLFFPINNKRVKMQVTLSYSILGL
jgi:hypothetical protein